MEEDSLIRISKFLIRFSVIVLASYLFLFSFFVFYYVHEGGHILFGQLNNLILNGKFSTIIISNWINHPLIPFIKLPQQTKILNENISLNFIFGGIILTILFTFFVSYIGYKISKDKLWFLFPIPIIFHEIFGNYFCGTDNLINNPLAICEVLNLDIFTKISVWFFLAILLVLFYRSKTYNKICNFFTKIRKFKKYRPITTLKEIYTNDPMKEEKIMYINGVNRLSDLISSVQRDIENKILLFVSILFSGLLGSFLTAQRFLESGLILGILFLLLLIALIKENRDKKQLYSKMDRIVKEAKEKTDFDLRQ